MAKLIDVCFLVKMTVLILEVRCFHSCEGGGGEFFEFILKFLKSCFVFEF